MGLIELIFLSIGLAMDAFAVSVCKGLSVQHIKAKHVLICGLWFGGFQVLMPLIGYLVGYQFRDLIQAYDHWIAFILLSIIGINMIREALKKDEEEQNSDFGFKSMILLAIATSIDALVIGVTFAFINVNIVLALCLIGVITFVISAAGVKIGNVFGSRYRSKAELAGGIVLILLGIKIILEHLGFLAF